MKTKMRPRSFLFRLTLLAVLFLPTVPARSDAPEVDTYATLSKLYLELKQAYASAVRTDSLLVNAAQRREQLSAIINAADEVSIGIYNRNTDFAFDLAFSLEEINRISASFKEHARLSEKYRGDSRSGLRRYVLLEETLRNMYLNHPVDSLLPEDSLLTAFPFQPLEEEDPGKAALLDSCMHYTGALKAFYAESVMLALQDSVYFAETERRLGQAYEFAQANYAESQKNRFIGGNVNIVQIVRNWDTVLREVKEDLDRYGVVPMPTERADANAFAKTWNGPVVLSYAVASLLMLAFSFLVAWLVSIFFFKRTKNERVRAFWPILSAILAIFIFILGMLFIRTDHGSPYWRMAYGLLTQFSWLTLAIFVSLLIRIKGEQALASRIIYIPTLLLAFMSILMRAIFLPASIVPLLFPPVLMVFIIWQTAVNIRYRKQVSGADRRYMWVSVGVMSVVCILSLVGYSMIGVLILTFWTFLLALLHTITTLFYLMKRYYENKVLRRKVTYHEENPLLPIEDADAFIEVTWLYDLIRMVLVPVLTLASLPVSIFLTGKAYQLSHAGAELMQRPLFQRSGFEFLSLRNILLVIGLFFVFRYLIYLIRALFRIFRLRRIIEKHPDQTEPLKESDVNLSLANALFSLAGWLLYLIIVFSILHIPTSALTAISAGLAAGVGFALKDLINNFFYGIQLMAGRIRVGDKISCDGVRGEVKRVSYQTTQVLDEDGSLIAFTNTDLFSKRFRNLNSGKNYELLKIPVGVRYGTDVEKARKVILGALKPLMTVDKYGRQVVDPTYPIDIRFDGFGDSSVNLVVVLYTTVDTHYTFPARAKEAIYKAFNENGIEIPFPQRDVYVKSVPFDPAGKE